MVTLQTTPDEKTKKNQQRFERKIRDYLSDLMLELEIARVGSSS